MTSLPTPTPPSPERVSVRPVTPVPDHKTCTFNGRRYIPAQQDRTAERWDERPNDVGLAGDKDNPRWGGKDPTTLFALAKSLSKVKLSPPHNLSREDVLDAKKGSFFRSLDRRSE